MAWHLFRHYAVKQRLFFSTESVIHLNLEIKQSDISVNVIQQENKIKLS